MADESRMPHGILRGQSKTQFIAFWGEGEGGMLPVFFGFFSEEEAQCTPGAQFMDPYKSICPPIIVSFDLIDPSLSVGSGKKILDLVLPSKRCCEKTDPVKTNTANNLLGNAHPMQQGPPCITEEVVF